MKMVIGSLAAILILFFSDPVQATDIAPPTSAQYLGNLHIGKVRIHPQLTYQLTYDTNINLSKDNEVADFIHTIRPGVDLLYQGTDDNFIKLEYSVGLISYTESDASNYLDHKADLVGLYETPFGIYTFLTDTFKHTSSSSGSVNHYNEGTTDLKHWNNRADLGLGYEFNKFRFEAKYANFYQHYLDDADWWQNRNDHTLSMTGYYRFMPKTSATLEYRFTDINYPNQDDGDNNRGIDQDTSQDASLHQIFLGLHFDQTAKVQGDVKLGIGRKNYINDQDWKGDDYSDVTSWIAETSLKWQATAKTTVSGDLARTMSDATVAYATRYTTTSLGLGLRHAFLREIVGFADAKVDYDEYDDVSATLDQRKDMTYTVGGGVEYHAKDWLSFSLSNYIQDRTSTFNNVEYFDNRTTLTAFFVY